MDIGELRNVLRRVNNQRDVPVAIESLEQVVALVVKNPLDDDRLRCQEQISVLVRGKVRGPDDCKSNSDS